MVKEKGPPESSVFTMFKRQTANTKLVVSDKQNDILTSSRVSIISKNPEADTTPNISVNRFINSASEPFVEDVPPPPPLTETFTSETFIGFQTADTSVFLSLPNGVAVDNSGNVFIADTGNHRIQRLAAGTGVITTVAGTGNAGFSGDGGGATGAGIRSPNGVAVDNGGNLFISDSGNHRIRRVAAGTGVITTVAGTGNASFSGDGGGATGADLNFPSGVAVDGGGNLFIADRTNNRIRRVAADTGIITTFAGTGTAGFSGNGGGATGAGLNVPSGVAVDGSGNLFIADTGNRRIRRVAAGTITTFAGNGGFGFDGDGGAATSTSLASPSGVVVDDSGNVFIADTGNRLIRRVAAGTGIINVLAGNLIAGFSGDGGAATSANLSNPSGVAVDGSGNLFIADRSNNRIRRVASSTGIITTVAGGGYAIGISNIYVSLSLPRGVVVSGNKVYVTDTARHNIYVLNKNTGVVSETYGTGITGTTATAGRLSFNQPYRIAVDSSGNIFVADTVNVLIRRINFPAGNTTVIAGGGANNAINRDTSSGIATTKRLNAPNGVAAYGSIVYFTNTGANTVCKVQGGNISNLPGSYSAPEGIAVDSYGNVYVANTGLNQISIVATDNSITNITLPSGGYPRGVAVDIAGNIYVADGGNNWILRLKTDSSSGVMQLVSTTIMAIGLNNPMDVSVDTDGTLYVADFGNNKIMKVVTTFV